MIRPFEPRDRDHVVEMADRLLAGVAPWRDNEKVRSAVRRWVTDSVDGLGDRSTVFVATADGAVVGFVSVSEEAHWSGDLDAYIGELVVQKGHEGRGIGRRLVAAAEQWSAQRGLSRIRLSTGAANAAALHAYEAMGYEHEDVTLSRSLAPRPQ